MNRDTILIFTLFYMIVIIWITYRFLKIPIFYSILISIILSNFILFYFYSFYKITEEKESFSLWVFLIFVSFSLIYIMIFILLICFFRIHEESMKNIKTINNKLKK